MIDLAWRRLTPTIPVEEGRKLCTHCAVRLRAIRERDRLVAPAAEQPRLF